MPEQERGFIKVLPVEPRAPAVRTFLVMHFPQWSRKLAAGGPSWGAASHRIGEGQGLDHCSTIPQTEAGLYAEELGQSWTL